MQMHDQAVERVMMMVSGVKKIAGAVSGAVAATLSPEDEVTIPNKIYDMGSKECVQALPKVVTLEPDLAETTTNNHERLPPTTLTSALDDCHDSSTVTSSNVACLVRRLV